MEMNLIKKNMPITAETISHFLKCKKFVWHLYNTPELTFNEQRNFSLPDSLEKLYDLKPLIYEKYEHGYEINLQQTYSDIAKETLWAVNNYNVIYNPGILLDNTFTKIDLAVKNQEENAFDLIKITNTPRLKKRNIRELALSKIIFTEAGIPVNNTFIYTINKKYIRKENLNVNELLQKNNVTNKVNQHIPIINKSIDEIKKTANKSFPPKEIFSPACINYKECPLKYKCWSGLPQKNVFLLTGSDRWKKGNALIENNVYSLKNIPLNFPLTEKQEIQKLCEITEEIHFNKQNVKSFLSKLEYPLFFVDFEATANMIIPLFYNSHAFQQIPYQFSLHIIETPGKDPEHHHFIATDKNDPRENFITRLLELTQGSGSIIAYNASFEKRILKQTIDFLGMDPEIYGKIAERFVDLSLPFENYDYYDSAQNGKVSLKVILPILTGYSYEDLNISEALEATNEYIRVIFTEVDEDEKNRVLTDLKNYCKLDTLGMIKILDSLKTLADH